MPSCDMFRGLIPAAHLLGLVRPPLEQSYYYQLDVNHVIRLHKEYWNIMDTNFPILANEQFARYTIIFYE